MNAMERLMQGFAIESGEVDVETNPGVNDSYELIEAVSEDTASEVGKRIAAVDQVRDVADMIDEISLSSDQPDLSAEAKQYLYESARRQFSTIARAYGLQASEASLEAKLDSHLPNELSKMASSLRQAAEAELDYSSEGLLSWLRRDAVKLERAYQVLESATKKIKNRLGKAPLPNNDGDHEFRGPPSTRKADDPIVIVSGSLREFLFKGQGQLQDLEKAIKDESADLHVLHAAADNALTTLAAQAKQLADDPESCMKIANNKWAKTVNGAKTNKAALMGNYSIRAKEPGGNPNKVDRMTRQNDTPSSLWKELKKSFSTMSPEMITIVGAGVLAIGAMSTKHPIAPILVSRMGQAAGIAAGKLVVNSVVNKKAPDLLKRPVTLSNESFKATLDTILEKYARFTSYEHDGEGIVDNLKKALKAGKEQRMDPEDYKTLEEVVKAHRESLASLAVISEAVCAQATYTVHQMSAVAISVLGKLK